MSRCKQNKIKLYYNGLQFVKETQTNTVQNTERGVKLRRSYILSTTSPTKQTQGSPHMPQGWTKYLYKCTLSKSLTHN